MKVLVANRGEIACRILLACQELGLPTVAVHSEPDADAPHVLLADEAVNIGEAAPGESYLNIKKVLAAAEETGAEAIHPGYGFLSENGDFAAAVETAGLVFIGPTPETIRGMGDKVAAKAAMEAAEVPIIPGHAGAAEGDFESLAEQIGYPVMVKAAAGGGGKGLRIVRQPENLAAAVEAAQNEARSAFGDETVLLEKYLEHPRHIEVQVLADNHGHVIHLYERECSIQRRHQKIIEESPSPALTAELRERMGAAAVRVAQATNYRNAGTVEFLYQDGEFYFLEMNTRLQVEHGVTELTTGVDIVKWQLRIAMGERLALVQEDIRPRGHAVETRLYAEDPAKGFLPSTGMIQKLVEPTGPNVRNDLGIAVEQEITSHYDPMLAKLLVWDATRAEAIRKMEWALSNYVVLGVATNIPFLIEVMHHEAYLKGDFDTRFIDLHFQDYALGGLELPVEVLLAAALYGATRTSKLDSGEAVPDPHSPWKREGAWRLGG